MRCAVYIHEDSDKRGSWSPHEVIGRYLRTSPDHYRSHIIHVKGSKVDRISRTIFFRHKYLTNPTVTHADRVVDVTRALFDALRRKKQGIRNTIMECLKKQSDVSLTTAKSCKYRSWEEPAKNAHQQPVPVQQV